MKRWPKWKRLFAFVMIVCLVLMITPTEAGATDTHDLDLWKKMKSLETIVSFMNTGAHPDDEHSALLAYMSLGNGVRTSSVIANRGEGGQNEIGDELGNGLGIIRSRELEEASKVTHVDLFMLSQRLDDPIYDFGFSKSPEETLQKWGEEVTYERLIRIIREQRPDILYPSFRDVASQHGHHRAISQLTVRAFHDAADPDVFPQHIEEGLAPWQPQKLYLPGTTDHETLRFNIGKVDPVYGKTYPQLGEDSRYLHRSQGMGRDLPVEDYWVSLELVESRVGKGNEMTIFDGLPYDFSEYATQVGSKKWKKKLMKLQRDLDRIISLYPSKSDVLRGTQKTLRETRQLIQDVHQKPDGLSADERVDLIHRLEVKERQLQELSVVASNVEVTLIPEKAPLTRGATTKVTLLIRNHGRHTLTGVEVHPVVPNGWHASEPERIKPVKAGETRSIFFDVEVAEGAEFFDPYGSPPIQADVRYRLHGVEVLQTMDPAETVAVLPDFGIQMTPEAAILNTEELEQEISLAVKVTNFYHGANKGRIRMDLPDGWHVEPEVAHVSFSAQGETQNISFTILPAENSPPGEYTLRVVVEGRNETFATQVQPIHYAHIGQSYWLKDSDLTIQAFPLHTMPGLKVGYVDSGFDQVGQALRQAGLEIHFLDEHDLSHGDLSQYDTIVGGIRAYLSREDLLRHNERLKEYVKDGGHVVMQYHKPDDHWSDDLPPYPLQLGQPSIEWRVTDEAAPVTFLEPEHPVFQGPNRITDEDFTGWVQERGLYFPSSWDDAYTPLLSMADPDEEPLTGGLLVAEYGEGSYVYSSLVWYRQIQHQVPGGYRMFVNLISYPHTR